MSYCRCCGADSGALPAGLVDSDGTFYSYLCDFCRDDIEKEIAREGEHPNAEKARALRELLGDGELGDGIETHMADLADDG
jgi:hypothetical protein